MLHVCFFMYAKATERLLCKKIAPFNFLFKDIARNFRGRITPLAFEGMAGKLF